MTDHELKAALFVGSMFFLWLVFQSRTSKWRKTFGAWSVSFLYAMVCV